MKKQLFLKCFVNSKRLRNIGLNIQILYDTYFKCKNLSFHRML